MPPHAAVAVEAEKWTTGIDRPAWIASINLAAARNYLSQHPPRLTDGQNSLLRLVESIGGKGRRPVGATRLPRLSLEKGCPLSTVAVQAVEIAAALAKMSDLKADQVDTELFHIHSLISELDQAVADLLTKRRMSRREKR